MEKQYENLNFYQKSENLKSNKSGFGNLTRSTAPQNLPKPRIDLKIVPICLGWSMVNFLVYGQLFSALNYLIAIFLDLQWNRTFDVAKKPQPF